MTDTTSLQQFLLDRYEDRRNRIVQYIHDLGGKDAVVEHAHDPHAPVSIFAREHVQLLALTTIVEKHSSSVPAQYECDYCGIEGQEIDCTYPCDTLRLLAMPYIGIEGYDPNWAVNPDYFDEEPLAEDGPLLRGLKAYLAGGVQSADEDDPGVQLAQSLQELKDGNTIEL